MMERFYFARSLRSGDIVTIEIHSWCQASRPTLVYRQFTPAAATRQHCPMGYSRIIASAIYRLYFARLAFRWRLAIAPITTSLAHIRVLAHYDYRAAGPGALPRPRLSLLGWACFKIFDWRAAEAPPATPYSAITRASMGRISFIYRSA